MSITLTWLLFFIYALLFSWLITRIGFFKKSGLSKATLVALFLLKLAAAVAYGLVMGHTAYYRSIADTWRYQADSVVETKLLFEHPGEWLTNLFTYPYAEGYAKLFGTDNSYWNDIKFNFLVKLLSIFNLFSFNHYYVNAVFFSFVTFFGWICLIRIYKSIFPDSNNAVLASWTFFPSFIFWCSGIHKDGFAFTGFAIFFYNLYLALEKEGFKPMRIAGLGLGLLILLPQSNYLVLTIVPLAVAWWLSKKFPGRALLWFGSVVALCILFFFLSGLISEQLNLPQALANKQRQFIDLDARSRLPFYPLTANISSYFNQLPFALNHAFLRPYIWESASLLYFVPALELIGIYVLVAMRFIYGSRSRVSSPIIFGGFIAAGMLVVLGLTVPILGALVRYRAFYLPLLVIPICAGIPWSTFAKRLNFRLIKK